MFRSLLQRLRDDVHTLGSVVVMHDHTRQAFFSYTDPERSERQAATQGDPWESLRESAPNKLAWQVYDHCAALTRLYAVYESFVDDLLRMYIELLPELYPTYDELPDAILKQHRVGCAQVLLKLGDSGPYRHLREEEVVEQMSRRKSGAGGYVLILAAFFVDHQNYRTEAISRLFGCVAIENLPKRIAKHQAMRAFLHDKRGDASTFESELNRFIQLRNDAAHSEVQDVIGRQEFILLSEFIITLCEIIAQITEDEVIRRRLTVADTEEIGTVDHVYSGGFIVVVRMKANLVAVGEQLLVLGRNRTRTARVESIQLDGNDVRTISATDGLEVGFKLNTRCKVGAILRRIQTKSAAATDQLSLTDPDSASIYVGTGAEQMNDELDADGIGVMSDEGEEATEE